MLQEPIVHKASLRNVDVVIDRCEQNLSAGAVIESAPENSVMANDGYKKAFDNLLDTYLSLGVHAETIVRQLKKTANAELRVKLVLELRNLEKKRLELLDQMDNLTKS